MDSEFSTCDTLESSSQHGSSEPRNIPLEYLRNITNNFSDDWLLGEGGFGMVYKGVLPNGKTIAVKKLNSSMLPGVKDKQFENEAYHLMRLKHPNILLLLGWCTETENIYVEYNGKHICAEKCERLLCLEYIPKGNLRQYLSDESSGLTWETRYKIIKGICYGLHYLHEKRELNAPIVHMDLKPANILLDNNMVPKIADFGLSRLFSEEKTWTCTKNLDGTLGYKAPEYITRGLISTKSDIFSLGVIIIEIVTGQRDYPDETGVSSQEYTELVRGYMAPEYINRGLISTKSDIFSLGVIIIEIVTGQRDYPDETGVSSQEYTELVLKNWRHRLQKSLRYTLLEIDYQQIRRCIHIGLDCVKLDRSKRPTISQVIKMLCETESAVQSHLTLTDDDNQVHSVRAATDHLIGMKFGTGILDDDEHGFRVAPQLMPLYLLRHITDNFSREQKLGSGTFGTVYKGVLNDKEVAVKLLHSLSERLDRGDEFMKEIEHLRGLNHPNIIQLLGYCDEIGPVCVDNGAICDSFDEMYRALCFDYMQNGSLQGHLDDESCGLDWQTRYKIIKGACEGLKYLHTGLENPMFHLDIKPGNILIDKNMVPKLAGFGLSELVCDNKTCATSSILRTKRTTKRYCPPEYIGHRNVSNKFDIFSLGVVIIELIGGSKGYNKAYEMPSQEFIHHVQKNWRKRLQATPGCTSLTYECRLVQRCLEIALYCISADPKQRPNIGDITNWLNKIENITEKLATTSTSENET